MAVGTVSENFSINISQFFLFFHTKPFSQSSKFLHYSQILFIYIVLNFFLQKMSRRQEAWAKSEDVALCIAVVTIGEDGAKGTNQEKKKLWERVGEMYESSKPTGAVVRSGGSCEARWKKISHACMKWRQALNKAAAIHKSGENCLDEVILLIMY